MQPCHDKQQKSLRLPLEVDFRVEIILLGLGRGFSRIRYDYYRP